MHADHAVGDVTLCLEGPRSTERDAIRRFNATHRDAGLHAGVRALGTPRSVAQEVGGYRTAARGRRCDVLALPSTAFGDIRGDLVDLTPYARARAKEFFPAALATGALGGRQAAIPQGVSVDLLFFRAGLRPPPTWEALYRDPRPSHAVMQAGDYSGAAAVAFAALLYGAGGRLLGPDGRAAVTRPAGRRALGLLVRGYAGGTVTPSLDEGASTVVAQFARGQGGFLPADSQLAPYLLHGRRVRVGQVPHFAGQPPRPLVEGWLLGVPRHAPNRMGALALLDWLTRPAAMYDLVSAGMAPPLKASYDDPALQPLVPAGGAIAVALRHGVPFPAVRHAAAILDALGRSVHAALAGDLGVGPALRQMTRDIDAIASEPGDTA
jgi:multiple sugar transport system substrate-binding protein